MAFDMDQFTERSAIREYDGGMTRFAAETAAAQEQGLARWQAIQMARRADDANGCGPAAAVGGYADAVGGQRDANDLSRVQRQPNEEARPVPVGQPEAGRDRGELLALPIHGRCAV